MRREVWPAHASIVGASFYVRLRKDDQRYGCTDTLVVGLLVVVAVLSAMAQHLQIPAAILLLLGGLLLSYIPGVPSIDLNPDLVLFLFLPPLIYAAAWQSSRREFRAALRPILLLSIGPWRNVMVWRKITTARANSEPRPKC